MRRNLTESEVYSLFADRMVVRGAEHYLQPSDAVELVDVCDENDLAVVGIEAFYVEEGGIAPISGLIADFSRGDARHWVEYRQACNAESSGFLRRIPAKVNLRVAVTVLSEQDWKS